MNRVQLFPVTTRRLTGRGTFLSPVQWLVALAAVVVTAPANGQDVADSGWYAGGLFGRSYVGSDALDLEQAESGSGLYELDVDESFAFGALSGYRWASGLRAEGEYLYRTNELERLRQGDRLFEEGDLSSVSISANLYFDFRRQRRVRPYVGLGLAWIQEVDLDFEVEGRERSFETDGSGFQAMGGVLWDVSAHWTLDFQIRSLDADRVAMEAEVGNAIASADYSPVDLQFRLIYRF